jgi:glycosyltransferase involved in cell wall biosynthesis
MSRNVCIINNYNYSKFLPECIGSVINQKTKFDVVIIVDDGSTDESVDMIKNYAEQCKNIKFIKKENGGQLSCFNEAVKYVDPSDFIALLDADDFYPSDYLQCLLENKERFPADMYFCEPTHFGASKLPPASSKNNNVGMNFVWATSSRAQRVTRAWTGSPTSCLSLSGSLFLSLLPFPYERDWVTRADDVIVFGAGLSGLSKCYLASVTIGYREHGANSFLGKKLNESELLRHEFRIEKMFNFFRSKFQLDHSNVSIMDLADKEIRLVPANLRQRFNVPTEAQIKLKNSKGLERRVRKLWNSIKKRI